MHSVFSRSLGCPCQGSQKKGNPWGAAQGAAAEEDSWLSEYIPLITQIYKISQSTPAYERMVAAEAELRSLIAKGAGTDKIIEAQAKLDQARRDVALENEYIQQKREALQLAKLGVLSAYAVGVAGAIYLITRVIK